MSKRDSRKPRRIAVKPDRVHFQVQNRVHEIEKPECVEVVGVDRDVSADAITIRTRLSSYAFVALPRCELTHSVANTLQASMDTLVENLARHLRSEADRLEEWGAAARARRSKR